MARLFVLSGASIGTTFDIDGTSVLGRGDDVDIVIREASVSRKHARLVPQPEPGVWKVIDLNSSNGLHLGGRRVKDALVRDGETFVLGDVELRLRDESSAATSPAAGAGADSDDPTSGHELELEFGDDLDRELTRKPAPKESRPAPTSVDRSGARATQQRAARRTAALGAAPASAAHAGPADVGRPVLQYGAHSRGTDIRQLSGGARALLVLAAIAVAVGVAYGAFELTRTARSQSAELSDPE